ncbi:recombinase family protein [Eubacterium oxidoreducens]|uniref:Resolvase, N terminal domain n=1 Tax=Eubacterium oxidoreducens TaxID=1732 RepID=A0A1G6C0M1_EUBOX|nr:recombinase family protein [Eubacterium oxidoreducens]SDB26416.1 Resolvase, N terminal domain [Eubacterium oxidoreducens]
MNYGYVNYFISNIEEDLDTEVAEVKKKAEKVIVDHLSYRPNFKELMETLKEGDTLYAYSVSRFASGLTDLVDTLKILNDRKISFVSITDHLTVDQSEAGQAALNALIVGQKAIKADPNHGFYA